jgi:N-acetylglucosaminyldiphosphoundecaprenol N-acetyl-beta-D-mannosaminyltransferase
MLLPGADLRKAAARHEQRLDDSQDPQQVPAGPTSRVWLWGIPFAAVSMSEAVSWIDRLIVAGTPSFFITANVHYAMLSHANPDLRAINDHAAFILADGMPLVWASRWHERPLPERVAGSDLIFEICALAAEKGYRLFFLGGAEGVAVRAAAQLCERFPLACRSPEWRALPFVN